ncbi:MAG: hypothetical protein GY777_20225 [Candidatus Brocadiaceae bacterium]|nr:hypothetical protein [Candidatus Brocadiaceae bacterium]
MEDLGEISKAVFHERSEILGQLVLGLINDNIGLFIICQLFKREGISIR